MGTLNEKLEYLSQTKEYIKEAIISKGQPVSSSDTFRSYASKIAAIENGDVITATNTTGSTVSADDRVWVEPNVIYNENFTGVGEPDISNEILTIPSNSGGTSIYATDSHRDGTKPIEVVIKVKRTSYPSSINELIAQIWSSSDSISYLNTYSFGLFINNNGNYDWAVNGNGPIHALTNAVSDTWYWIKISWTPSSSYTCYNSVDGTTWNQVGTLSRDFAGGSYTYVCFGSNASGDNTETLIDLSECYIKVDGNIVWTPYTETLNGYDIIPSKLVTSTSFTAIAQANIANNASGSVKTILDGNGTYAPTLGTKVITRNNTYSASTDDLYGYSSVTVNVEDIPAVVESLSITPTTSAQSFTPTSGVDGYSPVTVSAVDSSIDANITAGNIKSGVEILGVEGTYSGETPVLQDKVILANGEYTADEGYDGIGTATVAVNATGATEVATNRTGAAISAGDKVWINQEYYEAGTKSDVSISGLDSYFGVALPNNTVLTASNYGKKLYSSSGSIISESIPYAKFYNMLNVGVGTCVLVQPDGLCYSYDVYSNSFDTPISSNGMTKLSDSGTWSLQYYAPVIGNSSLVLGMHNGASISSGGFVKEIDPSTGEVLHIFTSSDTSIVSGGYCTGDTPVLRAFYIGNDTLYAYLSNGYTGGYKFYKVVLNRETYKYTMTGDSTSLSMISPVVGVTSDGKYAFSKSSIYSLRENESKVISYSYAEKGITEDILSLSTVRVFFDPESDCLLISDPDSKQFCIYKYNLDETFEKLSYSLTEENVIGLGIAGINGVLANIKYLRNGTTTLVTEGLNLIISNNLVNYNQTGINTITGTAAENIALGATGDVYLGDKGALQSKVATSNGIVTPSEGYYGLNKVTVNVVGTGVEVEGKNYTGAVINEGDKVWINPTYTEEGTVQEYFNSQNDSDCFAVIRLNENYTFDFWKGRLWNNGVLVGTAESGCYKSQSYNTGGYHPIFAPDGVVYIWYDANMQRVDSGLGWYHHGWMPIFGTSEFVAEPSTAKIIKIDPATGTVLKEYTNPYTSSVTMGMANSIIYLGNNRIYFYGTFSGIGYANVICTLDDNTNTYTHESKSHLSGLNSGIIGITSDYKYAIYGNNTVYDLRNISSTLPNVYTSKNFPAQIALYQNGLYFNGQTDMFCGCGTTANGAQTISDVTYPEVVYYNKADESFIKLPLVINSNYTGHAFSGAAIDNGELVCYSVVKNGWGQYVYSPYLVTITGNNLIPYGNQVTEQTQTGMATESISVGNTGTVKVGAFFEPVVETLNVTPTTSAQTITPGIGVDGYDEVLVSAVTSSIDPDIIAENIVEGVNILGVTGTAEITTLDVTTPRLVVVNNGTDGVAYTDDGGNTWSESEMPVTAEWRSIAFGNGRYVAIVETSNTTIGAYSDDGINWTQTTMPSGKYYSICYGDGKFVAISRGSSTFAYSTNGETWTAVTVPVSKNWDQIAYGNGKFVALSSSNSTFVYSEDGINWTESTDTAGGHIMFGGGKFISNISQVIKYSSNGVNWTAAILPTLPSDPIEANVYNIVYNGTVYLAACLGYTTTGYVTLVSSDGVTWSFTSSTTPYLAETYDTAYNLKNVKYDGTNFVGLTRNGQYTFTAGSDGLWTVTENDPALTGTDWNGMCYGEPVTGTTTVDAMLNMINGENITNYDELDDALDDLNGESA